LAGKVDVKIVEIEAGAKTGITGELMLGLVQPAPQGPNGIGLESVLKWDGIAIYGKVKAGVEPFAVEAEDSWLVVGSKNILGPGYWTWVEFSGAKAK